MFVQNLSTTQQSVDTLVNVVRGAMGSPSENIGIPTGSSSQAMTSRRLQISKHYFFPLLHIGVERFVFSPLLQEVLFVDHEKNTRIE